MPTGYTQGIEDGTITDLKGFALRCARAFGALIDMRDSPLDAKIPEVIEPSPYHAVRYLEEIELLGRFEAGGVEYHLQEYYDFSQKAQNQNSKRREEHKIIGDRYARIFDEVSNWFPPENLKELKVFMLDQIKISREQHRAVPYQESIPERDAWIAQKIKDIKWSADYHKAKYKKEKDRTEQVNEWLADLRKSFNLK